MLAHSFAGGVMHVTPAHGSPTQALSLQPFEQGMICDVYWHTPLLQVPLVV